MKILELNHVAIHVENVDRSCAFYSTVLRLPAIPRPAFEFPGAWFQFGTRQELHIIGNRVDPVISHNRGNHFALLVDHLGEWEDHFKAIKQEYRPIKARPDGALQLFLKDPDGHVIELFTPPSVAR
jgi:catechol 2,3-dioxygenase-like lactoylglutathione lyase family enzyme